MSLAFGIAATAGLLGLQSVIVRPKRSFASFTAYVTLKETHQDELQITDHPLERGGVVSDHAFMRPAEVTMECMWSNSPASPGLISGVVGGLKATVTGVQSAISGNSSKQVRDVYDKLLALQKAAEPFSITTGKRKYTDMLVRSLVVVTDKESENALRVTAICRQVIFVDTKTLVVPAPKENQKSPQETAATVNSGVRALTPGNKYRGDL